MSYPYLQYKSFKDLEKELLLLLRHDCDNSAYGLLHHRMVLVSVSLHSESMNPLINLIFVVFNYGFM